MSERIVVIIAVVFVAVDCPRNRDLLEKQWSDQQHQRKWDEGFGFGGEHEGEAGGGIGGGAGEHGGGGGLEKGGGRGLRKFAGETGGEDRGG